jgi:hypothetical protein
MRVSESQLLGYDLKRELQGGDFWKDPQGYWDTVVWPAYIRAHQAVFQGGDVERGTPNGKVPDLAVFDGENWSMTEIFEGACDKIAKSMAFIPNATEP